MKLRLGLGLGDQSSRPTLGGSIPPTMPPGGGGGGGSGGFEGHEIPPTVEVVEDTVVIHGKTKQGFVGRIVVPLGALVAGRDYNVNVVSDFAGLALGGAKAGVGFGFKTGNNFRLELLQGNAGSTRLATISGSPPSNGWNKETGHTVAAHGAPTNGTQHAMDIQLAVNDAGDAYDFSTSGDDQATWDPELTEQSFAPFADITEIESGAAIAAYFSSDDFGTYTITVTWVEQDAPTITTVYDHTFTSSDNGWGGFTIISCIPESALAAASGTGTWARFTVEFTSFGNGSTMVAYWGESGGGGGDIIDFNGNQRPVTFSGNGTLTGDGSTLTFVSDWIELGEPYDEAVVHNFAAQVTGTVNIGRLLSGVNGNTIFFVGGADAATTNKGAYAQHLTNTAMLVRKIEISTAEP